jgi:hypothetical protein
VHPGQVQVEKHEVQIWLRLDHTEGLPTVAGFEDCHLALKLFENAAQSVPNERMIINN